MRNIAEGIVENDIPRDKQGTEEIGGLGEEIEFDAFVSEEFKEVLN
jgi:hypothetical protein